tara:strand:+ start:124645 stop:125025 length:381 start_codon:yes stop_codon:yes gene_type:complete
VAEWSNADDCKSSRKRTGSNPVLATKYKHGEVAEWLNAGDCKSPPKGALVQIQSSLPNKIWIRREVVQTHLTVNQTLRLRWFESNRIHQINNSKMAEWLNAEDCKSSPKGALVQIQFLLPNITMDA